ncbi:MAG TPA: transporter substrate-binding domain-containing protein [Candidatus Pacebacteria bacterium]|nr:transporter substrate-binding domain-containing protein [Candidatus Paceibacterota bacterium]
MDLLEEISKDNNIEYSLKDTSTFSELIKIVEGGEVDMSIANITITYDREVRMDFSQPIFDSGLQIITQKNGSKKSLFDIVLESGVL